MVMPMTDRESPMMSPPSPEVQQRFKKLKCCVQTMFFCIVCRVISGLLVGLGVFACLVALFQGSFLALFGVFLLKDDQHIGRLHDCLASSCCQICAQRRIGGVYCLPAFASLNVLYILTDFVFSYESLIVGFQTILSDGIGPVYAAEVCVYTWSIVVGLIVMILSVWHSVKAFCARTASIGRPANLLDGPRDVDAQEPRAARDARPERQPRELFGGQGHTLGSA
eukprot:TRINITY_DN56926_c0_g1_i1.p1 TRINITY_DN56926_c0_g1~~TRINITY_DN56926_c0_g1_i1.p1  ORF type:complete len:224 (+),score=20.54 TRINITY_DN56926_c0_g1_i1:108-779(+)